jgi:tight adherence protein C
MVSLLSELNYSVVYGVALACVFGAVYLVAHFLLSEEVRAAAQDNLTDRNRKASNALVKFGRPFFSQYVVPMVRGKPYWNNSRIRYRRKIISAGLSEELTPDEFISFKFFLVMFFPIALLALHATKMMETTPTYVLGSAVLGFFYPDFWVNALISKRQMQILKSMPFIVDLLALSTEAGLDFIGAMQKVVDKASSSPLVDEFSQVLKEIKVGSNRAEALREMAIRVNMREINSFVAILISADQMGASIGKILKQQSEQIRSERMMRAEKKGARAATAVLGPVIFLLLPAIILMMGGPIIVGYFTGDSAGGFLP